MASVRWSGNAQTVTQVDTVTIALTWAAADTATITINGKTVTFVAADNVTANIAIGLAAAFNASTEPEFAEITALAVGSTVTLTSDTAGVPFTAASSESTVGTGTATLAHTTAASGPNWANVAANWEGGSLPSAADDIFFDNSAIDVLYGLDLSAIGTFTSVTVAASYTGKIGLPKQNANVYPEYRATYLVAKATTKNIGTGPGSGSGRIKIDSSSVTTTLNVISTGSAAETGIPAFLWKGSNASNTANVEAGDVGAAIFGGETATLATININGGSLICGVGVTLTNASPKVIGNGTLTVSSSFTGGTQNNGAWNVLAAAAASGTVTVTGGTLNWASTGTGTIVVGSPGGTVDFTGNPAPTTIASLTKHAGSTIKKKPNLTLTAEVTGSAVTTIQSS